MQPEFNQRAMRNGVAKFLSERGVDFTTLPDGSFLIEGEDALQAPGAAPVRTGQLARALAKEIFGDENALLLLNMAEFREAHDQHKLFGAPPGFIGSENDGMLASFLRKTPQCVLFLDEIDRVHPEVGKDIDDTLAFGAVFDQRGVVVSDLEKVAVVRFSCSVPPETQFRRTGLMRSMTIKKPLTFKQPGVS